ncbi:transglutaminase N-terminal domain-containing protein [Psychroserpens sp. Hel_I_66]|uniref:transglutaminase family protein n=1 Tax=Psychroserpens sp. Hel_I_66 TaxID=1250004 RepID=UPI00064557C2|nr:transglutaminase family protein [Psychroserpens sp. Hel_I_66]
MTFKITHTTEYVFDSEVFIEPHYLRFRPVSTSFISVSDFSIEIEPKPAGHKVNRDSENNVIDFCWFEGLTKKLTITSKSTLQTTSYNPFDFIIEPQQYNTVPFEYNPQLKILLSSALKTVSISKHLLVYSNDILEKSNFNTISFLSNLTNKLHDDFTVEYREEGEPLDPDKTFQLKTGSCRDLAWMQIHILRHLGFASRFVSGYYYFDMEKPAYELHAWVETYLPGTGWLGLDPSHGIFTGNTHFPIASSAYFENTMPVSGGIRGSANSKLITQLSIEKL